MHITSIASIDKSSKLKGVISIEKALEMIKNHPKKDLIEKARENGNGKYSKDKSYQDKIWDYELKKVTTISRNLYEHMKCSVLPVVTWNATFNERRRKANVSSLSGYIYIDIDDFQEIIDNKALSPKNNEEAKDYVWKILNNRGFSFIKAAWRSLGGGGYGGLVKIENLTLENFKSTWIALSKFFESHGISLDKQTKDITRVNVLSYDPEIFIRDDEKVNGFPAVEPIQTERIQIQRESLPVEISNSIIDSKIFNLYQSKHSWSAGRLNYSFYFNYFITCNNQMIDVDYAYDSLVELQDEYPSLFGHRDYNTVRYIGEKIASYYPQGDGNFLEYRKDLSDNFKHITGVNKIYKGDSKLYLEYLYYTLFNYELSDEQFKKFFINTKRKGILQSDLKLYFSGKNIHENVYNTVMEEVYGATYYLFGIIEDYNKEVTEKSIENFFNWCKENHYKVTKRLTYEGNVNRQLREIEKSIVTLFPTKGRACIGYKVEMLMRAKYKAIDGNSVVDYLMNDTSVANNEDVLNQIKKIVYEDKPWRFGLNITKILSEENIKNRFDIKKSYLLEDDEYISDLNLKTADNTIIWGDTGMGKTTWICEKMTEKRLVLVPIIPLLEGIKEKYGASVFYGEGKNVKEGDNLIVCTYSSFPKLLKIMEVWSEVKISEYELHFDEFHNFVVSSSPQFRGYELNHIVENLDKFKKRIYYTGTLYPILHPSFENLNIIRVQAKNKAPKRFRKVIYQDILHAIEVNLDKKNKNLIYLQNKKEEGRLGELMDYLQMKGWDERDIWCINADEKKNSHFKKLITEERVDDNVKILICTSVVIEGINIKNDDFTTIHFMSHEGMLGMEQMVNRLRNVFGKNVDNNCIINLYEKIDKPVKDEVNEVDFVNIQKKSIESAKKGLEMFKIAYLPDGLYTDKIVARLFTHNLFNKNRLYRVKDGVWNIDYFSIANLAYNEEKNYARKDFKYIEKLLSEYNWIYMGEIVSVGELTDNEKHTIRESKLIKQEDLLEARVDIVNQIIKDGEALSIDKAENDEFELSEFPSEEINLRLKVKKLTESMNFNDASNLVMKWVQEYNCSDNKWNSIIKQLTVLVGRELNLQKKYSHVNIDFIKGLVKFYKKEKSKSKYVLLKSTDITKQVSKILSKLEMYVNENWDFNFCYKLLEKVFHIQSRLVEGDAIYELVSIKIEHDVILFDKMLNEWITKAYEDNLKFSTQELAEQVNEIRSKLFLLKGSKIDANKASRITKLRYTIKRAGRKIYRNEQVNTYKVEALFPDEISLNGVDIKVIPQRKIPTAFKHIQEMTMDERKLYALLEIDKLRV